MTQRLHRCGCYAGAEHDPAGCLAERRWRNRVAIRRAAEELTYLAVLRGACPLVTARDVYLWAFPDYPEEALERDAREAAETARCRAQAVGLAPFDDMMAVPNRGEKGAVNGLVRVLGSNSCVGDP